MGQAKRPAPGTTMKIAHVIESFGGGCLTFLEVISRHLARDHEQVILHGTRQDTPKDVAFLFAPEVRLVPMDLALTANPFAIAGKLRELCDLLERENPDIVHCHSSIAGFYGRIASKIAHKKVVYTPHSYAFLMGGG